MGRLITFWSPWKGQAKVTASLCALATVFADGRQGRIAVCDLLERAPGPAELFRRDNGKKPCGTNGLSALSLQFRRAELTPDLVRRCAVPLGGALDLFPGERQDGWTLQEKEEREVARYCLLHGIVPSYDWTFVDLESGQNAYAFGLLAEADVAVVVLPQNPRAWEMFFSDPFFSEEAGWADGHRFFLIGGYVRESRYSEALFRHRFLRKEKDVGFGTLPFCADYMDAVSGQRVAEFFLRNRRRGRGGETSLFLKQARRTGERLCRFAEKRGREK